MPLVFACIAPHSGHLLTHPGAPSPVPRTRAAMETLRERCAAARPDAVAIIGPHGISLEGRMTLGATERASGELDGILLETETDRDLVAAWAYHAAGAGVPVAPLVGETDDIPFPLQWDVIIPVTLLLPGQSPPLAVACPSVSLTRPHLLAFGAALADAVAETGRRIAVIISADQGHGHAADGPYGFAPESAAYDQAMIEAIQADDLDRLLTWDDAWLEAAKVDSYWQTLCLRGLQTRIPLTPEFLSYEIDHYFGLICADYRP